MWATNKVYNLDISNLVIPPSQLTALFLLCTVIRPILMAPTSVNSPLDRVERHHEYYIPDGDLFLLVCRCQFTTAMPLRLTPHIRLIIPFFVFILISSSVILENSKMNSLHRPRLASRERARRKAVRYIFAMPLLKNSQNFYGSFIMSELGYQVLFLLLN